MAADIDSIALDVARRFTEEWDPQRRASLQVHIVEAILAALAARQSPITLLPDDPRIVKKIADEIERGKLDHPGFYRNTQLAEALRRMLDAALAAQPAQGIDLAQPAPSVTRYRIEDAPGLDPVTVYVENCEPGKGRMVVTCYASSWTAFWGAMGADTPLEQFVASCSPEYVADNMVWGADTKKSTRVHADKVAAAVVAFFKNQRDAAPGVANA
jgi:hypothetical protein